MELEIRLYNDFKQYAPGTDHVFSIALTAGTTVGQALDALNIPRDKPATVLLNGRRVDARTLIEPRSRLVVFAPVSGG
jgi:sulfur carrier protein ThiS